MALYHLNEGAFDLPDIGFRDLTVHSFEKKLDGDEDAALLVCRAPLGPGKTLEGAVSHYVKEEAKRFSRYEILESRETRIADVPAFDISARWFDARKPFYQRQAHLVADGTWLFFAMTSPLAERAACDECLTHILASFQLRR